MPATALIRVCAALTMTLGFATAPAAAQTYPSKPIKLIVPSSAGGITDFVGRLAADYISGRTGQPVIVENRAGAGGALGIDAIAKAAPDGYTIGSANTGDIISKFIHKNLTFDSTKDIVPVAIIGQAPQLLVVSSQVPAKTFQEFLAYARASPGKINYGSAGTGSLTQIGAEQLARLAGLQLTHVPYRGAVPAITDMISGRVQMMHISLNPTIAHIQAGTLRPLVVTAKERWVEYLPDVPTSAEAGLPEYEMDIWFGLVAPRGTPKPIVDQLNGYVRAMSADPALRKRIVDGFLRPVAISADEFAAYVGRDVPRWEKIIRESGVVAE
jgi:tripartite-type tricarboxylate transporter receptor subunit TctC